MLTEHCFSEIGDGFRGEFAKIPIARFAHGVFAAEFIESENEASLFLFGHLIRFECSKLILVSKTRLKPRFDEVLLPLGFRRAYSTWLRNNEETTFGVSLERQPVLQAFWIILEVWFSPKVERHKDSAPDMSIWLEELLPSEGRTDFQLLCDFTLDSWREPEDKAAEIALCLRDLGVPWLERFRLLADVLEACRSEDWTLKRAMGAEWRTKCQSIGCGA